MNIIKQLPPHVADMIAAGEVVERPASVVKELMENSADAGADKITVEIQRGGMSYIRVTDNGCGMSSEDAATAFVRHATSKLRDEYGLEAIETLGFRGEALAAISAVSRVQVLTREKGATEGCAVSMEAGQMISSGPAGCPDGTTMIIRDLFFNTPARLKFMKQDRAEGAAVSAAVLRFALSRPELSIRYIKDGEEQFQTPGDGKAFSAIYTLMGRDFASSMLPVHSGGNGIEVSGYVSVPSAARGNRTSQFFYVNGRCVKSQLLQTALEQAYKGSLFTGRFPACVLYISVKLNTVDVNIHPAKTEIKFLRERDVFDAVYRAVLSALSGENGNPNLFSPSPERESDAPPVVPREEKPKSEVVQRFSLPEPVAPKAEVYRQAKNGAYTAIREQLRPDEMRRTVNQLVFAQSRPIYNGPAEPKADIAGARQESVQPAEETVSIAEEVRQPQEEYRGRIIGEAFNEVILVESGDELVLIDKHAAHERMLFDALKAQKNQLMSQQLLAPLNICPDPEDAQLLMENTELLNSAGLEIEDFGNGSVLVRALPADTDAGDAGALLAQLADAIRQGKKPTGLGVSDEVLAAVACKAAIKAGRASDAREWEPVVKAVLSGKVKYCPHGRPVAMRITKRQIDKSFKRTT